MLIKHLPFAFQNIDVESVLCPGCQADKFTGITKTIDYDYFTTDIKFEVVRCIECGLIYVNPRPKLSEVPKIYPAEYSAYHFSNIRNPVIKRARNFMQGGKAKRILSCITDFSKEVRIIDVGCGSPVLLSLIRNFSRHKLDLYGNDFSPDVLESIKDAGFKVIPGAFEDMQWQDDFFDVIVMNQLLEHLFDLPANLRKTFKLLKPKGILFIETPSEEGLDAEIFRINHWGGYHIPRHLQIFSSSTIRKILQRYGFMIEAIEYIPSPNFWTSSVRNFLYRKGIPYAFTRHMNYRNICCMLTFTLLDTVTRTFHPTSNMRVIARKANV